MTKHRFTRQEAQKGGWSRARQKALDRVQHPTDGEKLVRDVITAMQLPFIPEYEIWNCYGPYPQWIDCYLPDCNLAIEVDGSHSWHSARTANKMFEYDENKRQWCKEHGVKYLYINIGLLHLANPETAIQELIQSAIRNKNELQTKNTDEL